MSMKKVAALALAAGLAVVSACGAEPKASQDRIAERAAASSATSSCGTGCAPERMLVDLAKPSFSNPTKVTNPLFPVSKQQRLVEALLAPTRGDEGASLEIEDHDLATVAKEAAQSAAGEKIAIKYLPARRQVNAPFDRDRIRQVVSILLDNAVKYTPEGGKVTVSARGRDGWA
jgi:hypothetical protein